MLPCQNIIMDSTMVILPTQPTVYNHIINATMIDPTSITRNAAVAVLSTTVTSSINAILATASSVGKQVHQTKSGDVSPVTLSSEWPRMARLLLLSFLSIIGTVGNVFMISSVMIEDHLKKAGNAFIVNVALADLLVTSIIMPVSAVVLLGGIDGSSLNIICRAHWFFAACSVFVTVLSLALTAIENYIRLCTQQTQYGWFNRRNTTVIIFTIWIIAGVTSGLQLVYDISFDYCTRQSNGVLPYQATIFIVLILLPLLLTFYIHIRMIRDIKRPMSTSNTRAFIIYGWDISLARTNFFSFLIFVMFWLPFAIVLAYHTTAKVDNKVFYTTAWIGLSKSCFHNVIYCILDRHFRNAYVNLFHYCCCKTSVAVSRRTRGDGICRPSADVRVHIIPAYNLYSPQRLGHCHGNSNKRDVHEL